MKSTLTFFFQGLSTGLGNQNIPLESLDLVIYKEFDGTMKTKVESDL